MGEELVSGSPSDDEGNSSDSALVSYIDIFYKHLPYYLSIGMTYEQYWNDDCCLVKYYRQAEKYRSEKKNQELWLQGAYIYEAVCCVAPVLNPFAKQGTKPIPYREEPYCITKESVERKVKSDEEKQYELNKAKFSAWAVSFNAQMKAREEASENG